MKAPTFPSLSAVALLLSVALSLAAATSALAWSGPILSPTLPFPRNYPPGDGKLQAKASAAHKFMRENLKLLDGRFRGPGYTFQRFGGTPDDSVRLIQLIRDLDLWDLEITFHDLGEQATAFSMTTSWENRLLIVVNTARTGFDRGALASPDTDHLPPTTDY